MSGNVRQIRALVPTLLFALLPVGFAVSAGPVRGDELRDAALRDAALREVELAQVRMRLWERLDYPLQQRRIESERKLVEAQIDSLKRRLAEYEQFTKFKYSAPLFYSLEEARVQLVAAQAQRDNLREEAVLLLKNRGDLRRLQELEVEAAKARLRAIDDVPR
jgi:hypothetical protein